MSVDVEQGLASLRREQATLRERLRSLEEQRRLHEKLGYSRYYLDMQLQALRGELALCEYHLRRLERGGAAQPRGRRGGQRVEVPVHSEITGRYLLPVIGAFIISMLALSAAGLFWYQRFGQRPTGATATPMATVQPTATVSAPVVLPTPTAITLVYAVVTTDGLNVRQSGGASAPVLAVLTRGSVVELAGDQVDADGRLWYRVEAGGWVAAEHVQVFASKEEAETFARGLR